MRIRCPQCEVAIELIGDRSSFDLSCPSCGTSFGEGFDTRDAPHPAAGAPPARVRHFELMERLGRGAFGTVWKAHDTQLDRQVALKIPRGDPSEPTSFERFIREAQSAARVSHPGIVKVFEVGRDGDLVYIASELVAGTTLRDAIKERTRYAPREAAELMATIADAIEAAHQAGVVHRDIKPSNVLLDAEGRPHITDFGLAKREAELTVTLAGEVLGTPKYMSPEQAAGNSQTADKRSDVYSLGAVLYELLCGQPPHDTAGSSPLLERIQHDDPPPLRSRAPSVPKDLETICFKALRKSPQQRYATAKELADDLRRYLAGEPIRARPVSAIERAWRWSARHPALVTASVSGALSLGLLVALLLPPQTSSRRIVLQTTPSEATVVFHPLDATTSEPRPERSVRLVGTSPFRTKLPPGDYLVVVVPKSDEFDFHEVYRHVPHDQEGPLSHAFPHSAWTMLSGGAVEIPTVHLPANSVTRAMCRLDGSDQAVIGTDALPSVPPHHRRVPAFWLDTHELTVAELQAELPDHPAFLWYKQHGLEPGIDQAAGFLSWDEAVALAEHVGKRLPEEWELEVAATLGGTRRHPWGDAPPPADLWSLDSEDAADFDRLPTEPPIVGLFSNVAEWTSSRPTVYPALQKLGIPTPFRDARIVRGAPVGILRTPPTPVEYQRSDPRERLALDVKSWRREVGLRMARSVKPRLVAGDFGARVAP